MVEYAEVVIVQMSDKCIQYDSDITVNKSFEMHTG